MINDRDDLMAVIRDLRSELVEHQAFLAELAHRDVDQFLVVLLGHPPPASSRRHRGQERDLRLSRVETGSREQAFLQCVGEVEPRVAPNVGNAAWREQEH